MGNFFTKFEPEPVNWNDLPNEMKAQCISNLDLKSRARMRQVSKSDKKLVDSTKIPHKKVRIEFATEGHMNRVDVDDEEFEFTYQKYRKMVRLAIFVLSTGDIDFLRFNENDEFGKIKEFIKPLKKCPFFRAKQWSIYAGNEEMIDIILGKAIRTAQKIQMDKVQNSHDVLGKMVYEWIAQDVPVGTTLQWMTLDKSVVSNFKKLYDEEFVRQKTYKDITVIRLKTRNPSKQMALMAKSPPGFCKFQVVASDSEDQVEERRWMSELDPTFDMLNHGDLFFEFCKHMADVHEDPERMEELKVILGEPAVYGQSFSKFLFQ